MTLQWNRHRSTESLDDEGSVELAVSIFRYSLPLKIRNDQEQECLRVAIFVSDREVNAA
jgi:hypothetical protein